MDAGQVPFGEKTKSKFLWDDGLNTIEVVAD